MEAEEENLSDEKRLSLGQEVFLFIYSFFGEEVKEPLSSSSMTIFDILPLSKCVPIHFV